MSMSDANAAAVMESLTPMARPGPAIAALLAAGLGVVTLAIVNLATEMSAGFLAWVWGAGKVWVPDAQAIGPYSGLETFMLLGWLVSWPVLYLALRNRTHLDTRLWVCVFAALVLFAVIMIWPPVVDAIKG